MKKRGWQKGVKRGSKKLASIGYYEVMEKLKTENRPTEGFLSDGHLCLLYQKGDRFALGILYERHRALLAALARNAMDHREGSLTAEEIESEIYLILSDAAEAYFKAKGKEFTEVCAMKLIEAFTPEISECVLAAGIEYEEDVQCNYDKNDEILNELVCDTPSVEYQVEVQLLKEYIEGFFRRMRPHEADVIRKRFGFEDEIMTLAAIGKEYNVTRERVRQMEWKGKCNLRKIVRKDYFYHYLQE